MEIGSAGAEVLAAYGFNEGRLSERWAGRGPERVYGLRPGRHPSYFFFLLPPDFFLDPALYSWISKSVRS